MTLDDLERRNSPYFAFYRRFRFLCWPNTSQWLNVEIPLLWRRDSASRKIVVDVRKTEGTTTDKQCLRMKNSAAIILDAMPILRGLQCCSINKLPNIYSETHRFVSLNTEASIYRNEEILIVDVLFSRLVPTAYLGEQGACPNGKMATKNGR